MINLQALGLIIRKNNLFYLEREVIETIKSKPLNIIEGEIPLNPESRISTGSTLDLFERIELKFDGCKVKLEKAINYDY